MRALAIGLVLVLAPAARALCPPEATTATYLQSSFGVGVRTLDLVDRSRRTPPHAGLPGSPARAHGRGLVPDRDDSQASTDQGPAPTINKNTSPISIAKSVRASDAMLQKP